MDVKEQKKTRKNFGENHYAHHSVLSVYHFLRLLRFGVRHVVQHSVGYVAYDYQLQTCFLQKKILETLRFHEVFSLNLFQGMI